MKSSKNKKNNAITQLFPTKVYSKNILLSASKKLNSKKFIDELTQEIYTISRIDKLGQEWSEKNYFGGFTSYGSMDQLYQFSTTFDDLKKIIDKHVYHFITDLEYDIDPKSLTMSKFWVNIMPRGVIHTGHIHPMSVISGTFYVQIPKKTPSLKFEDPKFNFLMAAPPKKTKLKNENLNFYHFIPKVGDLVLFESWLRHEVSQNTTNEDRISLSFNYDWIR